MERSAQHAWSSIQARTRTPTGCEAQVNLNPGVARFALNPRLTSYAPLQGEGISRRSPWLV